MQQTDLVKALQIRVNKFDAEVTGLYKNINELKALQTLSSGGIRPFRVAGQNESKPEQSGVIKEVYGFWAITRQYFDD